MKAIRAKTLRDWLKANFTYRELREMSDYGANTGWPGLTATRDVRRLYQKFGDEIWETIADEAMDIGVADVWEFMHNCDAYGASSADTAESLLVWAACEIIARRILAGYVM